VPSHEGTGRLSLPTCKQLAPPTSASAVLVKATRHGRNVDVCRSAWLQHWVLTAAGGTDKFLPKSLMILIYTMCKKSVKVGEANSILANEAPHYELLCLFAELMMYGNFNCFLHVLHSTIL